jgi:outer membrane protein TolC
LLKAQTTTGEERLDQLQRESFIRQQRSEAQNTPFDRPLAPESNPLQVEQDIQRQLNLPSSNNSNSTQPLERLQNNQRIRQQLRQQNRPPAPELEPQSQAALPVESALPVEPERREAATVTRPSGSEQELQELEEQETVQSELSELRPSKADAKQPGLFAGSFATETAQVGAAEADPVIELVTTPPAAAASASEQAAPEEPAQVQIDEDKKSEESNAAETVEASPVSGSPAAQAPAIDLPDPITPPPTDPRIDTNFFTDDAPAPDYLDPDPNPLAFPTSPDEVEIVGTQPITLRQAVELALRNNAELRQAQLTLERTQAELRETQSSNFPTLGANAQFNQQGSESASRQPDTNFLGQPNPDAGDIEVTYGDSTTLGAGLQLDYTIFTSGRRPALIEAARGQVRLQQLELERQVEQLIFETATNYYDLQEAGAQVNIFSANLAQAEQSLRDAQALERAGVGTRFDVLQAEVEVANARQDLTQQLSELEIARRELAQQINVSEALDIAAADPIEVSGVWDLSLEESIIQAYKNRVELEQSLIQREIAERNRRAALAQLGPQVGFSGAFNVVNDFDNDFTFLHNYQLGLTVTQSLYDGGVARSQANQQESNIAIAESEFENRREQVRFEVERAYSQLDANFANIQTTALAVEQAAEALRLARLRFQAGVGTQTDVLRQQTELARSQVNNLSAILSYNRAIVALQRAVSNYPEGSLNDVP